MVEEFGNAWVEAQIDGNSITLSLMTETQDGATVEETARYTFAELQEMSGEQFSLSLSDDTRDTLSDLNGLAVFGDAIAEEGGTVLSEGDIAIDPNAPHWSQDNRVEVVEVLEDTTCEKYVAKGPNAGEVVPTDEQRLTDDTVADMNQNYDSDDTVVLARYCEGSDVYAFPSERLELA
jgi:hypothetical protein